MTKPVQKTLPKAVALMVAPDANSATISIRGMIGDWWEGKTVDQIENQLDWIPVSVKALTVRVTSMGGDLAHGLAIQNALRRFAGTKTGVVEGVAASAATIALFGCDRVVAYVNSAIMIHGVKFADEDGNEVSLPDAERALNQTMIETYAAKTGKTHAELAEYVSGEDKWMTAREALELGFIDEVIEITAATTAEDPAPVATASAVLALASASGVPEDVILRAQAQAEAAAANPEPTDPPASEGGDPQPEPAPAPKAPAVTAEATFASKVNAVAVAHGLGDYVAAWLLDGSITTSAQAEAAIKEAREVRDLCNFANATAQAEGFIKARKPLAEVRAALINDAAARADANSTDSTRPVAQPSAKAAADIWAKHFPPRQT